VRREAHKQGGDRLGQPMAVERVVTLQHLGDAGDCGGGSRGIGAAEYQRVDLAELQGGRDRAARRLRDGGTVVVDQDQHGHA